jgi:hypothetical protein
MPRYTPAEKSLRSLSFEVRVLEVIIGVTGEAFKFTRYQPSNEIIDIKLLAEKRLKTINRYKATNRKHEQKDNKIIFESGKINEG